MRLHNIIAQTQAQPRSLSRRLCGEEWLKDFVFDGGGNAGAVVGDGDFYPFPLATPSTPEVSGQA